MTDAELEVIGRNLAAVRTMLEALERELFHVRVMQKYTRTDSPPEAQRVSAPVSERT